MNCIDFRVADSRVSGPTTPTLNRHSFVDASEPFSRQPRFPSGSFSDLYKSDLSYDGSERGLRSHAFYSSTGFDTTDLLSANFISEGSFPCGPSSLDLSAPLGSYSVNLHSSRGFSLYGPDTSLGTPSRERLHPDPFLFDTSLSSQSFSSNRPAPPLPCSLTEKSGSPQGPTRGSPPPLPPRSYLVGNDREAYSAAEGFFGSASMSHLRDIPDRRASLPGIWSHSIPSVSGDASSPHSVQLTASAAPFVAPTTSLGSKDDEGKREPEVKDPRRTDSSTTERKKGAGEDVDIAKLRSGEETRSAVMIRNIPNRFSPEELGEILDPYVKGIGMIGE